MKIFFKYRIGIALLGITFFLAGCATKSAYLKMDSSLQKDLRTFSGSQYVPLIRLVEVYGLEWKWDSFTQTASIEKGTERIVLRGGSDRILVDGSEKKLEKPVLLDGGAVFVPVSFVRNNLKAIAEAPFLAKVPEAAAPEAPKKFTIKRIVLDPGHGGYDVGAIGRRLKLREKNLTLAIARKLKGIMEENGIEVVMTRDNDTFIPLKRRADIANKSGADLFVSVHINASRTNRLKGFECYYLSDATDDNARALEATENASLKLGDGAEMERSDNLTTTLWDMALTENRNESVALARHICSSVESSFALLSRGIRSARFYVLKYTRIPAVLVENGYISNRYEEMKLKDTRFLGRLADALAQGILSYKKEYERTEGFTKT